MGNPPFRIGVKRARAEGRCRRPAIEPLEGRALLAVGFSELPFSAPTSFVTGADGNFYYIPKTQDAGGQYDQIDRLTPSGTLAKFTVPSKFTTTQVADGPDGNIWFVDEGTIPVVPYTIQDPIKTVDRIGKLTPSGQIAEYPLHLEGVSNIVETVGDIAPGPDGDVWFVDYRDNLTTSAITTLIGRITPTGQITLDNAPGASQGSATTGGPATQIVGGADGDLYYTEPGVGSIGRLSPSGTVTQVAIPGGVSADYLVLGPDGNVWFTDPGGVGRVTPSGSVALFADPGVFGYFSGQISPGPDGNLWFTEADGVGRVTPSGTISNFDAHETGDEPDLIGIGPQHALLFTYANQDDHLVTLDTTATAEPPTVTATPEVATRFENLATEVAHFTSNDPGATIGDYRAVVHYDDKYALSAQGIIVADPSGGYDAYVSVPDGFSNVDPTGTYASTVTVFDTRSGATSEATATGSVNLMANTPPQVVTLFTPTVTIAANGLATAAGSTFLGGQLPASTYTATISFGDGSPAVAATVTAQVETVHPEPTYSTAITNFTATASHKYAKAGGYIVVITFRDNSGNVIQNDTLAVVDG